MDLQTYKLCNTYFKNANAGGTTIVKASAQMAKHPNAAVAGLKKVLAFVSKLNRVIRIPTDLVTAIAAIVR